jgi:hypothetical protein
LPFSLEAGIISTQREKREEDYRQRILGTDPEYPETARTRTGKCTSSAIGMWDRKGRYRVPLPFSHSARRRMERSGSSWKDREEQLKTDPSQR